MHIPREDRPSCPQRDVHLCALDGRTAINICNEGPLYPYVRVESNDSACSALKPRTRRLLISSVPLKGGCPSLRVIAVVSPDGQRTYREKEAGLEQKNEGLQQ